MAGLEPERQVCPVFVSPTIFLQNFPLCEQVAAAEAVPALVALLSHETMEVVEQATGALKNLALHSDAIRNGIIFAGGLPPLMWLLCSAFPSAVDQAARLLAVLVLSSRERSEAAATAGTLPLLVGLLGHPVNGVVRQALGVLRNLATAAAKSDVVMNEMVAAGVVPPIVAFLSHPSSGIVEHASAVIMYLARGSDSRRAAILKFGTVPLLCSIVQNHSASAVRHKAAGALQALGHSP